MNLQDLVLEDFDSIKTGSIGSRLDIQVDFKDLKYSITTFPDNPTQAFLTIHDNVANFSRQSAFIVEDEKYNNMISKLDFGDKSSVVKFFNDMVDLSCGENSHVILLSY